MFTPKISAAEAAAISVNVSLRVPIDAETLVGIFKGTHSPDGWMSHIALFFSDVPDPILMKFMAQNNFSGADMLRIFQKLSPCMRHKHFIEFIQAHILATGEPTL